MGRASIVTDLEGRVGASISVTTPIIPSIEELTEGWPMEIGMVDEVKARRTMSPAVIVIPWSGYSPALKTIEGCHFPPDLANIDAPKESRSELGAMFGIADLLRQTGLSRTNIPTCVLN